MIVRSALVNAVSAAYDFGDEFGHCEFNVKLGDVDDWGELDITIAMLDGGIKRGVQKGHTHKYWEDSTCQEAPHP